jgi:hypothetical protein
VNSEDRALEDGCRDDFLHIVKAALSLRLWRRRGITWLDRIPLNWGVVAVEHLCCSTETPGWKEGQ